MRHHFITCSFLKRVLRIRNRGRGGGGRGGTIISDFRSRDSSGKFSSTGVHSISSSYCLHIPMVLLVVFGIGTVA